MRRLLACGGRWVRNGHGGPISSGYGRWPLSRSHQRQAVRCEYAPRAGSRATTTFLGSCAGCPATASVASVQGCVEALRSVGRCAGTGTGAGDGLREAQALSLLYEISA